MPMRRTTGRTDGGRTTTTGTDDGTDGQRTTLVTKETIRRDGRTEDGRRRRDGRAEDDDGTDTREWTDAIYKSEVSKNTKNRAQQLSRQWRSYNFCPTATSHVVVVRIYLYKPDTYVFYISRYMYILLIYIYMYICIYKNNNNYIYTYIYIYIIHIYTYIYI